MEAMTKPPAIDDQGYLLDPAEWSESLAQELARQENIELTEQHWTVIHFMRDFFGYVKQACRIAGMRKPRSWSTG